MDNHITQLLGIKDDEINVLQIKEKASIKTVVIERKPQIHFCPHCGHRMYSKGIYIRKVNHPVMQDGMQLILEVHQRRWLCKNESCRYIETDSFSFIDKH